MMRCTEPGWVKIGMTCKAGRRSMWIRLSGDARIEICAGREGDDAYVSIDRSNPQFEDLLSLLEVARFAAEETEGFP